MIGLGGLGDLSATDEMVESVEGIGGEDGWRMGDDEDRDERKMSIWIMEMMRTRVADTGVSKIGGITNHGK